MKGSIAKIGLMIMTVIWSRPAAAQFVSVSIGVNGLTCSQCTRNVEMSLRKLDFVADVKMNLEHTEGEITIRKDRKADMDKVAQAVVNAGFSLRYLKAKLVTDGNFTGNGQCYSYNGDQFVFVHDPGGPPHGAMTLTFIGKKFMPKAEYRKLESMENLKCGVASGKVYYVDKS